MAPDAMSARIAVASITSIGCGEGTTRRQPRSESLTTVQPFSAANASAVASS